MNKEADLVKYWDLLRTQTKYLNRLETRRGVLLFMPWVDQEAAVFPRISAERHARIPQFQYFLNYIRGIRGDSDPNDPFRRRF